MKKKSPLVMKLKEIEKEAFIEMLSNYTSNSEAARKLGMDRSNLLRKARRLKVTQFLPSNRYN